MKVNDVVYLVYDAGTNGTAFKVKILTDFVTSNKPIYRGGGPICTADYLFKYEFDTGWQTPEETIAAGKRDFSGLFRTQKRNLYATWEEARAVLNKQLAARIKSQNHCVEYCEKQLEDARQRVEKAYIKLYQAKTFDLDAHFNETPSYISPFTGEEK